MALFDFLKFRKDKQGKKVAEAQQQIVSLQEAVFSLEKEKEELISQVQQLKIQINESTKEFDFWEAQKEKAKNDLNNIQSTYDKLSYLLQTSTTKIRCMRSSSDGKLTDFNSEYLVALDANDFNELSSFNELKEESEALTQKKNMCDEALRKIESTTRILKDENETLQQQHILLQQQVSDEESKRDELKSHNENLKKQIVVQSHELYYLQNNKEKAKQTILMELDDKVQEKEENIENLNKELKEIQTQIDFAICELKNIKMAKGTDVSSITMLNENPTKEEIEEIAKKYEILRCRYYLVKPWMDKYEKDLELAKSNLDLFIQERRNEIRQELIHELYQKSSQCESSMLRHLSSSAEVADIEEIRNQLKIHKHTIKKNLPINRYGEEYVISYSAHPIYQMCNIFMQLNIVNIIKDMKLSDWETIKMKIAALISNINSVLFYTDTKINEEYLNSIYHYMEAKYLIIQKQEKEREEREAQREYERAIKKALKDEEKAQETLEKKKRELAEEQAQENILKLQEQIQDLEKALREARELKERAMSMAQQTKIGFVYVISNIGSFGKDVYKIGMTRRLNPMERVLELSNASVPFPFDVHTFIYSEDAPALEAELHRRFDDRKINSINYRKEYFHVTLDEIKNALSEKGVHADFIDEPDAFQYRESVLKNNTNSYTRLSSRQAPILKQQ